MVFVENLRRSTSLAAAALLLVASAVPLLAHRTASAYTLLGDREIRMETAVADATGVNYRVDFNLDGTQDVGGIVVTFCEGSPIIGDATCDVPTGFAIASNAFADGDQGLVDVSGFTAAVSNVATVGTADNVFTLTGTPIAGASGDVVFTLTNVTNPSAVNESFYARIMVYADGADATAYTTADDPELTQDPQQAGGIALSTAEVITIEAKVQERITFCVFAIATGDPVANDQTDCSQLLDPVVLGNDNGVLDSSLPSISREAMFNITTNASAGATVRMNGGTLETGSFSIAAIGDTAAGYTANTEQFGLCVFSDPGAAETGGLTATAPYDSAACDGTIQGQGAINDNGATFAFHTDTASTYGSPIAQKTAGDWSTGVLVFLGGVSNTTEPGIYTTTLDFVATGRY